MQEVQQACFMDPDVNCQELLPAVIQCCVVASFGHKQSAASPAPSVPNDLVHAAAAYTTHSSQTTAAARTVHFAAPRQEGRPFCSNKERAAAPARRTRRRQSVGQNNSDAGRAAAHDSTACGLSGSRSCSNSADRAGPSVMQRKASATSMSCVSSGVLPPLRPTPTARACSSTPHA
jgi:hypothetical protein